MAISGIGGSSEPIQDATQETVVQNDGASKKNKKTSIFDKDKNGEISIEEIQEAITQDKTIKKAVAKGFDLNAFLNILKNSVSSIPIFNAKGYDSLPKEVIKNANKYVQDLINVTKQSAIEFLKNHSNQEEKLKAPKKMGEGWGLEDEHIDYIFAKLEQAGIPLSELNIELFSDIVARYDYSLDKNNNSMITPREAEKMQDGGWSSQFLNKDQDGNPITTHVLDWIVNRYIEKAKKLKE